jgi:hypothetical protein
LEHRVQTLKQMAAMWLPRPREQSTSFTLGCARTKSETASWPKDLGSSSARLQLGQTPKFELLDEHGAGVQSDVSTMDATHFLLCVDVDDEEIVGCCELKLIDELGQDEGSIFFSH